MSIPRGQSMARADLVAMATKANGTSLPYKPYRFFPEVFLAANQAEMLRCGYADDGGTFPAGIVVRTDAMKAYQLTSAAWQTIGAWAQLDWKVTDGTNPGAPADANAVWIVLTNGAISQWYVARYALDGVTLGWDSYLNVASMMPELDRIRANCLAGYVTPTGHLVKLGGEFYYTPAPLNAYSDERFAFPGTIAAGTATLVFGKPYWRDPVFVFPDDGAGASVTATTRFIIAAGAYQAEAAAGIIRVKFRITGGTETRHLSGHLRFDYRTPVGSGDLSSFITLTDNAGLVTAISYGAPSNGGSPWDLTVDKDVTAGDYELVFTAAAGHGIDFTVGGCSGSHDLVGVFNSAYSVSAIHNTRACLGIDLPSLAPCYSSGHDGYPGNGTFNTDFWYYEVTFAKFVANRTDGYFWLKPFAIAALNCDPFFVAANGQNVYALAPHAHDTIAPPPLATPAGVYRVPRLPFRRAPATATISQLPFGCTISSILVGRKSIGTPNVFLPANTLDLTVQLGCIRSGAFVSLGSVTIPAGARFAPLLTPWWINFTGDTLAYTCSEAVDIQAMVAMPSPEPPFVFTGLISDPFHINPVGTTFSRLYAGPLLAHHYNDTMALLDTIPP